MTSQGNGFGREDSLDDILVRNFDPRSRCSPESDDAHIEFEGFKTNILKQIVYWVLVIGTVGFFWLLCRWVPTLNKVFNMDPCSLEDANRICAKGHYKEITPIYPETRGFLLDKGTTKYFTWRHQVWRWHCGVPSLSYCAKFRPDRYAFEKPINEILALLDEDKQRIHESRRSQIYSIFGENLISITLRNPLQLLIDEVLHPFYIFQLFSVILWFVEAYWIYAVAIIIISAIGACIGVIQARRNLLNLKKLAEFECKTFRYNSNGTSTEISSKQLVPGDIIELKESLILPCDVILLQGQCVVNEAMLTGESIPVIKSPTVYDDYDTYNILSPKHAKYTLFGGTEILQVKTQQSPLVLGVVAQTAYSTTKGGLVRSILFPKPLKMKFYRDSFFFIIFLFLLAMIGFSTLIHRFRVLGTEWGEIVIRGLDLITIAIPPALPIALTIGVVFAVDRLKKKQISCIAPSRVNLGGLVEIFCFDKTGTLTEEGLDVKGVCPSSLTDKYQVPCGFVAECNNLLECRATELMKVLASCHALALLNGKLIGDALEVKMFEATGWEFQEISHEHELSKQQVRALVLEPELAGLSRQMNDYKERQSIGILKQFDFSSELQRMSTICKDIHTGQLYVCTKGAPEVIGNYCIADSMPDDYNKVLIDYTKHGFRVLGCAIRPLDISQSEALQLSRDDVERDLYFTGLLIMQNKLKPETAGALRLLNGAGIGSVMITGDNPLTACYVAQTCQLVDKSKPVYLTEVTDDGTILWHDIENPNEPRKELFQVIQPKSIVVYGTDARSVAATQSMPNLAEGQVKPKNNIELAVTGNAFEILIKNPQELETVLKYAHIFARMKPDQKQKLVEIYGERGLTTGMCGDGANDCGALKAADVGISLSEAEASIAAPFTSAIPNINCVNLLLQEGRCALVTSFQAFKYMASYSLIQFSTSMILFTTAYLLSDMEFLWIDLFIVMPLAFASEYTGAYRKLSKRRPITSLMSWSVITSLLFQVIVNLSCQIAAYGLLYTHECNVDKGDDCSYDSITWFTPQPPSSDVAENSNYAEVATVFLVANFQYIFAVLAFSVGKPFRKPFYSNIGYVIMLIVLLIINTALLLYAPSDPDNWLLSMFDMPPMPFRFRFELLVVVLVNGILVLVGEEIHHYLFTKKDICNNQAQSTKKSVKQ